MVYLMTAGLLMLSPAKDGSVVVNQDAVTVSQEATTQDKANMLTEDFESGVPAGWTIINQDVGNGMWHWATPHGFWTNNGTNYMELWWSYNDQNEWLITPDLVLPANIATATFSFTSYVWLGSTYGDKYWLLISDDGGSTWDTLDEFSTHSPAGWDSTSTWSYDIASYAGSTVKVAWQAYAIGGLWYVWFVDHVVVDTTQTALGEKTTEAPVVFKVWPNPSAGPVNFALPAGVRGDVAVYDVSGRVVDKRYGVESTVINLDPGIYLYRATVAGNEQSGRLVVK